MVGFSSVSVVDLTVGSAGGDVSPLDTVSLLIGESESVVEIGVMVYACFVEVQDLSDISRFTVRCSSLAVCKPSLVRIEYEMEEVALVNFLAIACLPFKSWLKLLCTQLLRVRVDWLLGDVM